MAKCFVALNFNKKHQFRCCFLLKNVFLSGANIRFTFK